MRTTRDIIRGFALLLLLALAGSACSQEPKKPKITASGNAVTVYKPADPATQSAKAEVKDTKAEAKPAAKPEAKAKANKPAAAKTKGQAAAKAETKPAAQAKTGQGNAKGKAAQGKAKGKAAQGKGKAQPKEKAAERFMALKTNLPLMAVVVQNLAFEVELQRHISLEVPVLWSISDIEREHALRTIAFQPEGRWWLKRAGEGHFFGLHAHVAWFNLKWDEDRYQSGKRPLLGAGISYGYRLPLSAHWGAEFNLGAGYANMQYDTYYNIENGAKIDTRKRHYWGLTRVGLSLSYRF